MENADLVGLSTPFITDPEFAVKIQEGNESDIQLTIKPEALEALAIPKAAFKDIVPLMDFESRLKRSQRFLQRTRSQLRGERDG